MTDVLASGKHLLNLINEILDLAKVESGKMELQFEPAFLQDVFESVQHTMRALAAKKSIDLRVENDESLEQISMDGARIKQVLLNLVGNAIKFTPEAGQVWVKAQRETGRVRVEVGDSGPGIPAAEQERIFQEFQQVESERQGQTGGHRAGLGAGEKICRDAWRRDLGRERSGQRQPVFLHAADGLRSYLPQRRKGAKVTD